ncbi:uncharacterized protein LOC131163592 [Malania oleifera]|uniref:uncharacterized protein LOC131163592 n=1 Tax=Malania oleifera TaxID=397392 RepID=UPI0025ADBAF0|nr:uncharacterized protein LOC131163592 [Malania oleifera]
MAAFSLSHSLQTRSKTPTQELIMDTNRTTPRTHMISLSCQTHKPNDPLSNSGPVKATKKRDESPQLLPLRQILSSVGKLGKGLKDSLSPKQKGDWKDLVLMSFSFAVYVYMSQKIVCAYCAWMSILK